MQTIQLNQAIKDNSSNKVFHLWKQGKLGTFIAGGTTVPASKAGYGKGCLYFDLNASAGSQLHLNTGTLTSNTFTAITVPGTDLSGLLATAAEINRAADVSTRLIDASASTLAVTLADHEGKVILLNRAGGVTATLPAATGTGGIFRFQVKVTSTAYVIAVASASDIIQGTIMTLSDDTAAAKGFSAAGTSDTITLNATTKGGLSIGDWVELTDIASGVWAVRGLTTSNGTEVTPFSAAV